MSDKHKITKAFRELRKKGWFARMNFWCCQSCGCAAVPDDCKNKFVFYHKQDAAAFDHDGNITKGSSLYLTHGEGGDGYEIVNTLKNNDLNASWNGDNNRRIEINS